MNPGKPLKVYLSGGMEFAKKEGADWRRDMEDWSRSMLGHEVFNPNRESDRHLARMLPGGKFRELKQENIGKYVDIVRELIDTDIREIAQVSDYVVCYWDESAQRGAGTKGEVTIARFVQKPVYLVTTVTLQDIPGWVLGCATNVFSSFEELKNFLLRTYLHERPDR